MFKVSSAVATHPGLKREGNEDTFCVRPDLGLYVVADGMGGHAAGEVASQMAVASIEKVIESTQHTDAASTWPLAYDIDLSLNGNRLNIAFLLANRHLGAAVAEDDNLRGLGTTSSAILISGSGASIAHVGDSRAYLWRAGELRQLTKDHSWVGEQVRAGVLSDADARRHPWRNVVTRALTGGDDPEVDITELPLEAGDRLLICSDGLSSVAAPDRLVQIMDRPAPLEDVTAALIAAANEAGGPDNITAVVIQIDVA
jgi:protein phosphatase